MAVVQVYNLVDDKKGSCMAVNHTKSYYGEYDAFPCGRESKYTVKIETFRESNYNVKYVYACSVSHLNSRWRRLLYIDEWSEERKAYESYSEFV